MFQKGYNDRSIIQYEEEIFLMSQQAETIVIKLDDISITRLISLICFDIFQLATMHCEEARLSTFVSWPGPVSPLSLVAAGFHYLGQSDKVKCFCCNGTVLSWERGDDPMVEHRRHFPNCSFVKNPQRSANVTFRFGEHVKATRNETGKLDSANGGGIEEDSVTFNSYRPQRNPNIPKYIPEEMIYEVKRLETLKHWPLKHKIDINPVATDGLYYVFEGDKLKCAFCNGAMINWDDCDIPAQEHRKYFRDKCPFIKGHQTKNVPIIKTDKDRNQYDALNIVTERPRHQNKASEEARLQSFCNWAFERVQSARTLAKAGFFSTGKTHYSHYN